MEQNGEILFLAQTQENGNGFTLPGGKIEGAEFVKEGLIRETKEEIGIDLKNKQLTLRHVTYKKLGSSIEIIFFFYTDILMGIPVIREPEKFKEIKWFLPKDYPKKMPPVLKKTLLRFHDGNFFTEFPKSKKKIINADKLPANELGPTFTEKKKKKPVAKKKIINADKLPANELDPTFKAKKKKKPIAKKKITDADKLPINELNTVSTGKKKKKPVKKKETKIKISKDNLPDSPMTFTI